MRVDVAYTPREVESFDLIGKAAVVIDVLRATTTIVTACANGCERVIPVADPDTAMKLAESTPGALLGGERKALALPGFDLGNSPLEYTANVVSGRTIIMTTTNGTSAFLSVSEAGRILACSFLNVSAVANSCVRAKKDILIVCSGLEGKVSLEDTACAGSLVDRLAQNNEVELGDGAIIARNIATWGWDPGRVFAESRHGRFLESIGKTQDLSYCAQLDSVTVVPEATAKEGLLEIRYCVI